MKKTIILFCLCITFSCDEKPSLDISLLNGYWEIQSVKQNNKLLKTYPFSGTIDFFEVNNNKGLRKKVNPKFDGKFITSMHQINFNVYQGDNNKTQIEYYDLNNNKFIETIIKLDSVNLYLTNKDNYIYHYKVYEKLNLD